MLLAAALLTPTGAAAQKSRSGAPNEASVAQEARQTIAMIEWFYVQHRACPDPLKATELHDMEGALGDGFSVERQGQFTAIRGISMSMPWLYYVSPQHPDRCALWRKLDWDAMLVWRRHGGSAEWVVDPGDGSPERPPGPGFDEQQR
ncbi:MAG: hypothetical protein JO001_27285 [Alphaproteobacteria bacterium]|nr:hypothetical protein [Alphaproteobacteria bacterium]